MPEKKVIVVMGATGAQGGGLVRAILADKNSEFSVRAVTRDTNSDKAKALAAMGAEVVTANVDDVESLKKVYAGAYGAFGVTFFWDHFNPQKETAQAKAMADAAKATGIKHFVWSTLEDTRKWVPLSDTRMPTLMEAYKVPHFDSKGEADAYFTQIGVPTTFLQTSFYWENFIYFGMGPQKTPEGNLAIFIPMGDKKLPGIAVEDIGKCAYGVFKRGAELIGKTVAVAGEHLTGDEIAAELTKNIGKPIANVSLPFEVYRGLGFPGAEDVSNMFQFKHDFEKDFVGARNLEVARSLNPELKSFSQWAKENASRIPLPE